MTENGNRGIVGERGGDRRGRNVGTTENRKCFTVGEHDGEEGGRRVDGAPVRWRTTVVGQARWRTYVVVVWSTPW